MKTQRILMVWVICTVAAVCLIYTGYTIEHHALYNMDIYALRLFVCVIGFVLIGIGAGACEEFDRYAKVIREIISSN